MLKKCRDLLIMGLTGLFCFLASQAVTYSKPKETLPHDPHIMANSLPLKEGGTPFAKEPVPPQDTPQGQRKSGFGPAKNISEGQNLGQIVGNVIKSCMDRTWVLPTNYKQSSSQTPTIQMKIEFDPDGAIIGEPQVTALSGSEEEKQVLTKTALAALKHCSPFEGLPRQSYDLWRRVIMNFTAPSQ